MERSGAEYQQTGLPSPFSSTYGDTRSEASSADHTSAAQQYQTQPDSRSNPYPATATPTSEFGVYPSSARSASFPEHVQRPYHPAGNSAGAGGMAQTPTNPSIAAPSPTYATNQYSPYGAPPQDMTHGYQHPGGLYAQPRPDWAGYAQHAAPLTPGHHVFPQTPTTAAPQSRPNQVYSFVPIPGAQQHKRPRRRYEEIERMYKCGWNGCEKAYGTLNHLNAHVTMQSHGSKRTPEEFKEIRKEWKARKKEEEAQRKAEEERQRQAAVQNGGADGQGPGDAAQSAASYPPGSRTGPVQLPPIGYSPGTYTTQAGVQQSLPDYSSNYVHGNYPPTSPYGTAGQQMYSQHNGGQTGH